MTVTAGGIMAVFTIGRFFLGLILDSKKKNIVGPRYTEFRFQDVGEGTQLQTQEGSGRVKTIPLVLSEVREILIEVEQDKGGPTTYRAIYKATYFVGILWTRGVALAGISRAYRGTDQELIADFENAGPTGSFLDEGATAQSLRFVAGATNQAKDPTLEDFHPDDAHRYIGIAGLMLIDVPVRNGVIETISVEVFEDGVANWPFDTSPFAPFSATRGRLKTDGQTAIFEAGFGTIREVSLADISNHRSIALSDGQGPMGTPNERNGAFGINGDFAMMRGHGAVGNSYSITVYNSSWVVKGKTETTDLGGGLTQGTFQGGGIGIEYFGAFNALPLIGAISASSGAIHVASAVPSISKTTEVGNYPLLESRTVFDHGSMWGKDVAVDGEGNLWGLLNDNDDVLLVQCDKFNGDVIQEITLAGEGSTSTDLDPGMFYHPRSNSFVIGSDDGYFRYSLDSGTIEARNVSLQPTTDEQWVFSTNGTPRDTFWKNNGSNYDEYDIDTLTLVRNLAHSLWVGLGSDSDLFYDPFSNSLISAGGGGVQQKYLDRVTPGKTDLANILNRRSIDVGLIAAQYNFVEHAGTAVQRHLIEAQAQQRETLDALAPAYGIGLREQDEGGVWKISAPLIDAASIDTVDISELGARDAAANWEPPLKLRRLASRRLPSLVTVASANPLQNFMPHEEAFRRADDAVDFDEEEVLSFPQLALTPDEAIQIAERRSFQADQNRTPANFKLMPEKTYYAPGDNIDITDGALTHRILITKTTRKPNFILECEGVTHGTTESSLVGQASRGHKGKFLRNSGPVNIVAMDSPLLSTKHERVTPIIYIAAFPMWDTKSETIEIHKSLSPNSGFSLVTSIPGNRMAAAARLVEDLADWEVFTVIDKTNNLVVNAINRTAWTNITAPESGPGYFHGDELINPAAILSAGGIEYLRYRTKTLQGDDNHLLFELLRKRRNTENYGAHVAGDLIVFLDPATIVPVNMSIDDIGKVVYFRAVPAGADLSNGTTVSLTYRAKSKWPVPPRFIGKVAADQAGWQDGKATLEGDDDVSGFFSRRSRAMETNTFGRLPILEETLNFRIVVYSDDTFTTEVGQVNVGPTGENTKIVVDDVDPHNQQFLIKDSDLTAWGIPAPSELHCAFYQRSTMVGNGEPFFTTLKVEA